MNSNKLLCLGFASIVGLATAFNVAADTTIVTFRTTGYFIGLTQGTNTSKGVSKPIASNASFAGHNLVNLAMGRALNDTNYPSQVMAMSFACDLSTADLVVYDLSASNILDTIASSVSVDSVYQQDSNKHGPDSAQFVTTLNINPSGDVNGLVGGYLTVSGRLNLNPTNGCPQAITGDHDSLDFVVGNADVPNSLDPDRGGSNARTGLAHLTGSVDFETNGNVYTVLVPYGDLSIRRQLATPPPVVSNPD